MEIPGFDLKKMKKHHCFDISNQLKGLLPYAFIITPGVCLLKDAAVLCTYKVEYPDLESSSAQDIAYMSEMINQNIMGLSKEEGWSIWFDCKKSLTKEYPAGRFTNLAGWLIDERRNDNFKNIGEHFITDYYITFVWQLPPDTESKTDSLLYKKNNSKPVNKKNQKEPLYKKQKNLPEVKRLIEQFETEVKKTMGSLSQVIYHKLDNSELYTYLKTFPSMEEYKLHYPEKTYFFLDEFLTAYDVDTSIPLKVGPYYVPVITITDFPNATFPAMFDALNRANVEYRWTTRFIPLSKEASMKQAEKYQKRFFSARKSGLTLFTEMAMDVEIDNESSAAIAMEGQANSLIEEIALSNLVLGYYTCDFVVWDENFKKANEKARFLQQIIKSCGFGVKEETLNNFSAWLGMMPGNVHSNCRRPLITSQNLSHIIPLSEAWQGEIENDFTQEVCGCSIPHLICSTSYGTPFFLNLNVSDVGNTFIFGPVGSGKSTLLALLMAQATKYPDANIICIDKQLSSRAFMIASGGVYVEPGKDDITFQPLSELKNPDECTKEEYDEALLWCQQFMEGLFQQQGLEINPVMSKAITETLILLSKRKDKRSQDLTSFQGYINYTDPSTGANTLKMALEPYCKGGEFGNIFDSDSTNLNLSKLMTIEMGSLMRLSEKAVAPALMYIFRYLEKLWNVPVGEKQKLTFLFLDEAWLYLQHPIFEHFIQEWLRTLRKKKVFCIFATQEVSAVCNSNLKDTIIQQCLTKIYLADKSAVTLQDSYMEFGLTESEIETLSVATPKRDYLFKNPNGCRLFKLDLDELQLALITSDHKLLDDVEKKYGKNTGQPLAFEIIEATKQKYIEIGKNPEVLDYSKYKELLKEAN